MSQAVQTALAIPELVEQILLHLPITDLLIRIQRINTYFRKIIDSSPRLQHRLFFSGNKDGHDATIRPNPLLYSSLHAYINPERKEWVCSEEIPPLELCEMGFGPGVERKGFRRKDASWRRMLVVVPPVKGLYIETVWGTSYVRDEGGVRMDKLSRGILRETGKRRERHVTRYSEDDTSGTWFPIVSLNQVMTTCKTFDIKNHHGATRSCRTSFEFTTSGVPTPEFIQDIHSLHHLSYREMTMPRKELFA
ncbi:hypothetical protein NHQ30_005699 [Ciborinia camelliae]|nr:hypothetical protein NHQ30_005699 [Ciborinia camelliae]